MTCSAAVNSLVAPKKLKAPAWLKEMLFGGKARSFLDPFSLQRSPVLLCNTRLPQCTSKLEQIFAHSRSQHNFACKASTKKLPSTSLCSEVCTKKDPVSLRTPKLAQSKPQYDFAIQSLHKAFSSTTSCYKILRKEVPSFKS